MGFKTTSSDQTLTSHDLNIYALAIVLRVGCAVRLVFGRLWVQIP